MRPYLKNKQKGAEGKAQVIENLPSKSKDLISNPNKAKTNFFKCPPQNHVLGAWLPADGLLESD
jgi:hypothetical protein